MVELYRINKRWVFDVENNIGYNVVSIDKKGMAKMKEAFRISSDGNKTVEYYKNVPIGVVRKSLHLVTLKEQGKLEELEREIKPRTTKNGGVRK